MLYRFLCTGVLALLLFTCNGNGSYAEATPETASRTYDQVNADDKMSMEAPQLPEADAGQIPTQATQQKIVYTAEARARVAKLDSALMSINQLITRSGGFLSSQRRNNSTYEHTAQLTIRLPAEQLKSALAFLPRIALEIDFQNLDSRNVTAEWLDLETRLQTKRDVRDRYVDILRNRAQKVEDILNAEDKIRVITEEIEAREGQLRYLRDQVSLSTLELTLYETIEYRETGPTVTRGFGSKLASSLAFGWAMVQDILLGAVAVWPLLLLGGVLVFGWRKWRRK
jgi:hypothetical protein